VSVIDVRHGHHRSGIPVADLLLLDLPFAQPIIKRIGEAVPAAYPGRMEHVLRVASIAVRAQMAPRNRFAEATL
jgi:hypothetical protein